MATDPKNVNQSAWGNEGLTPKTVNRPGREKEKDETNERW
jgi:hypothetical protein